MGSWLVPACTGAWQPVQKMSRPSLPCPRSPCPRLLLIRSASEAANMSLHRDQLQVQLDRRFRLGDLHAVSPPHGLRARASTVLRWRGTAAGWRRGWLRSCRGTCSGPPELVLGGCRWPRATRAPGPRRGVSRGSRRSSGAAAAARLQRASRASWRRIEHLRCCGGARAARDGRWSPWAVVPALLRLCVCYVVCLVPGGGRTVCQGGSLLYKKMSAALT